MPITFSIEKISEQSGDEIHGFFSIKNQNEIWPDLQDYAMSQNLIDLTVAYRASYTSLPTFWVDQEITLTIANCEKYVKNTQSKFSRYNFSVKP